MALPSVVVTVKDGGLGVVPPNIDGIVAVVGVSSLGAVNLAQQFDDINALRAAFGTGPLVEAAAYKLTVSGGPVVCVRVTGSVPGSFGAVTLVGTGLSVLTLTGSVPVDTFDCRVSIVTGGANPASAAVVFTYSIDGGDTVSGLTALPASGVFVIPGTGVTLNFSAATLVAGDVYSFTTTSPGYSTTDLGLAIDAALASPQIFPLLQVVGTPANSTALQAVFALVEAKLQAAAAGTLTGVSNGAQLFCRGAISCINDTPANIATAVSSLAGTRTAIAAGEAEVLSFVDASLQRRSSLSVLMGKAASLGAGTDVAQFDGGLVRGVVRLYGEENANALDNIGLSTLRTHKGNPGFYVGNFRLKVPTGSDFQFLQFGRVMDIACRATRQALLFFLNKDLLLDVSGKIDEGSAQTFENYCEQAVLEATVRQGFASNANVTINRNQNVLATQSILVGVSITPLGYAKSISAEVGFVNPRFAAA